MKAALVVAHPDDEVLWFGGLVASWPVDWTIICCSVPARDSIRAWKFFEAVERLGAKGQLIPSVEPGLNEGFAPELLGCLDLQRYDRIVTHGAEGEYGHHHHKALYAYVHGEYAHKEIWSSAPPAATDVGYILTLDKSAVDAKYYALKAYDHVLPYEGEMMPKWEALLKRYKHWGFNVERYRIHAPR